MNNLDFFTRFFTRFFTLSLMLSLLIGCDPEQSNSTDIDNIQFRLDKFDFVPDNAEIHQDMARDIGGEYTLSFNLQTTQDEVAEYEIAYRFSESENFQIISNTIGELNLDLSDLGGATVFIRVRVKSNAGVWSEYTSIEFTVSGNKAPIFSGKNQYQCALGNPISQLEITAVDPEGDQIQVADDGQLDLNCAQLGEYTSVYTFTDAYGAKTSELIQLTVFPEPVIAQIITPVDFPMHNGQPRDIGGEYQLKINAEVKDGDIQLYQMSYQVNAEHFITESSHENGIFTLDLTTLGGKIINLQVRVQSDRGFWSDSVNFILNVDQNDAPIFTGISEYSCTKNQPLEMTLTAIDPEQDVWNIIVDESLDTQCQQVGKSEGTYVFVDEYGETTEQLIQIAALIMAGKLNANCSDLRFYDESENLSYWIDDLAPCDDSATLVWVKTLKVESGTDSINMLYGKSSLPEVSSCTDAFYFCDQFSDNVFAEVFERFVGDDVEVNEVNNQIEIAGTATENNQYKIKGFATHWTLDLPIDNNYAFDANVKFTDLDGSTSWKAAFGGWESNLAVYNGGDDIGFFKNTQEKICDSNIKSKIENDSSEWLTVGTGFTENQDTYFIENNQVICERTFVSNQDIDVTIHRWGFAAQNTSSEWKILVDNLRIRRFRPNDPDVLNIDEESYIEPMKVTVKGIDCDNVKVNSETQLTCKLTENVQYTDYRDVEVRLIDDSN